MHRFETILNKAISTCEDNFRYSNEFSRLYTFTTENISGYLKYFNLKDKKLLTVGSSGDQILNAYFNGARDITLYDINEYAKYYIYLKIAAILSLNYTEFQYFFFKNGLTEYTNKQMFNSELFNKIKPILRLLDYESYLFFDELFCLYEPYKIREYLFNDDEDRNKVIKSNNIYLRNENVYNKLKSIVKSINFKYINGNIFENEIDGQYDNIFLSNLCTKVNIDKMKSLLNKLDKNNLNEYGSILFGYLYQIKYNERYYEEDWHEMYRMPIIKEQFKDYIKEYHQIKSSRDFIWDVNEYNDLVLIYRKNKK